MLLSTHRLSETGRFGSLRTALAVVLVFGAASEVRAGCKIEQVSEFHVESVAGSPMIEGQLNGQPLRILLETGSVISYLTRNAAKQFKLPLRHYTHRPYGSGGYDDVDTVNVKELLIGQVLVKDHLVNVGEKEIGNGAANFLLGADYFSQYVTEFDLGHGVVRLLRTKDCKLDQLAYWSAEFFKVELERFSPETPHFIVNIKVNGKEQKAILGSGSAISYISLAGAGGLGIEPSSPGVEPAEPFRWGSTNTPIPTWTAHFDTIEVAGETIKHVRLRMGDVISRGVQPYIGEWRPDYTVELGYDFFKAHRILIAPDQRAVLFTYNGGRVF